MTPDLLQPYLVVVGAVVGGLLFVAAAIWLFRDLERQRRFRSKRDRERVVGAQKQVNARLGDTDRLVEELRVFAEALNVLRPRAGERLIAAFPCVWQYRTDAALRGVLVVTNQRLRFDGPGRDWTRTWDKVAKWDLVRDSIVFQLENEASARFRTNLEDPDVHPRVVLFAVERGYEASKTAGAG